MRHHGASHLAFMVLTAVLQTLALRAEATTPQISRAVVDDANVLSPEAETAITHALEAHRSASGLQMAVLTVASTGAEPIEDFSLRVATEWGGGTAKQDNGVLFVMAVRDRRMRLEVGYGLEALLSDHVARRIIDAIKPQLRAGDFDAGAARVVNDVIRTTGGNAFVELPGGRARARPPPPSEPTPPPYVPPKHDRSLDLTTIVRVLLFLLSPIVFVVIRSLRRGTWRWSTGSGSGSTYDHSSWSDYSGSDYSSDYSSSSSSDWSGGGGSFGGGGASSSW